MNAIRQNAGRGIGPILEARDVFFRYWSTTGIARSHWKQKHFRLAGKLLDLCFADTPGKKDLVGEDVARDILTSGKALVKMREIIRAQGGHADVASEHMHPGRYVSE